MCPLDTDLRETLNIVIKKIFEPEIKTCDDNEKGFLVEIPHYKIYFDRDLSGNIKLEIIDSGNNKINANYLLQAALNEKNIKDYSFSEMNKNHAICHIEEKYVVEVIKNINKILKEYI